MIPDCERTFIVTYVVALQVGVVHLDAVVQDGHHHALAREARPPRRLHVHAAALAALLWMQMNIQLRYKESYFEI